MEFNEATYDKIYKHLHNQLTKADKEDFEMLMSQNPDLVGEVEKHRNAESMVLDAYLLGVRQQTQNLLIQKRKHTNLKKWLGGSSMVFVLSAGIATYINFTQEQSSLKTQQASTHSNTLKNSSISLKTQPNPTIESPKPVSPKVVSTNKTEKTAQVGTEHSTPIVDLDKEAQLLYLKQLEQQKKDITSTSKNVTATPAVQTPSPQKEDLEDKKQVSVIEQSKPVYVPAQELLFDIVYEPKQGLPLEIPTGGLEAGKFKIMDENGVTVYEAPFDNQNKAVWNGQSRNSNINQNKQLNVLMFNNKEQPLGLGKISVIQ